MVQNIKDINVSSLNNQTVVHILCKLLNLTVLEMQYSFYVKHLCAKVS